MLSRAQLRRLRGAPATPNRLRAAMEELELTQLQLEAEVGIPQATISRLINGVHQPGIDTAGRLARHFGCRIEDLWPSDEAVAS